ncbi:hypothetical protein FPRO05_03111 [Fusarium proliferatum]|uniref:NADH:flavin oxidoreductase/NADH oxidase N-terminal domain-containing protein n=1 Tax=Gibberella intermedia TaxID=948311 RepID=A0A365N0J4_GIBIN|nr:hypothetical protein FPRO05_03111 [Fusarium proliferatum]
MAERLADKDGLPGGKQCLATYSEWAKGGWGLIISGNVHIDPAHPGAPGDFTVNRDLPRGKTLTAWKSWASACSLNGTKAIVQINHPGRQAPFVKSLAPSPIPLDLGKGLFPWLVRSLVYGTPKEMTQTDIDDVVTRFAEAAQLSVEAGFAGVEIHAAHGYLLAQFLSPLSNERTDSYGGSPLARAKIVIDVVKAVRKAVPAQTCVGIKVNSTDHTDLGEFIIQLRAIVDAGVDFVEVSGGSIEDPMFSTGLHTTVKASTKAREAFFIDFANAIRSELPDVPIMLTGGFRTRQGMEAAVKGGSCDLVGLARPSVIDPALPKKVLDTSIPENGALAYAKRIEAWNWAKYTGIKAVGMGAETERKPRIIVVEAGDRPFAAASSACTGCFHYHFPGPLSKALTPLGKYSFDLWAQEAQNPDFRLATGYRENSSYGIQQGDGKGLEWLPNWIKTETSWDVDNQVLGVNTATVCVLQIQQMADTAVPRERRQNHVKLGDSWGRAIHPERVARHNFEDQYSAEGNYCMQANALSLWTMDSSDIWKVVSLRSCPPPMDYKCRRLDCVQESLPHNT